MKVYDIQYTIEKCCLSTTHCSDASPVQLFLGIRLQGVSRSVQQRVDAPNLRDWEFWI